MKLPEPRKPRDSSKKPLGSSKTKESKEGSKNNTQWVQNLDPLGLEITPLGSKNNTHNKLTDNKLTNNKLTDEKADSKSARCSRKDPLSAEKQTDAQEGKVKLESKLDLLHQEHLGRLSTRSKKANSTRSKKDIRAAWQVAFKNYAGHSCPVPPTDKEIGVFLNNITHAPIKDINIFFSDVCTHWVQVQTGALDWVNDMPLEPDFGFTARFVKYFMRGTYDLKQGMYNRSVNKKYGGKGKTADPVEEEIPHTNSYEEDEERGGYYMDAPVQTEEQRELAEKIRKSGGVHATRKRQKPKGWVQPVMDTEGPEPETYE